LATPTIATKYSHISTAKILHAPSPTSSTCSGLLVLTRLNYYTKTPASRRSVPLNTDNKSVHWFGDLLANRNHGHALAPMGRTRSWMEYVPRITLLHSDDWRTRLFSCQTNVLRPRTWPAAFAPWSNVSCALRHTGSWFDVGDVSIWHGVLHRSTLGGHTRKNFPVSSCGTRPSLTRQRRVTIASIGEREPSDLAVRNISCAFPVTRDVIKLESCVVDLNAPCCAGNDLMLRLNVWQTQLEWQRSTVAI